MTEKDFKTLKEQVGYEIEECMLDYSHVFTYEHNHKDENWEDWDHVLNRITIVVTETIKDLNEDD